MGVDLKSLTVRKLWAKRERTQPTAVLAVLAEAHANKWHLHWRWHQLDGTYNEVEGLHHGTVSTDK